MQLKETKLSKLQIEILKLSEATEWEAAVLEWKLDSVYTIDDCKDYEICLCGHFPVKEVCVLLNTKNEITAHVGNCCVKKFLDNESDLIFKCIKRLQQDITNSLNSATLKYVYEKHILNNFEYSFYEKIMLRRSLSQKQWNFKIKLNKRVLKYLSKSYVGKVDEIQRVDLKQGVSDYFV